jgi:hypothetical protein
VNPLGARPEMVRVLKPGLDGLVNGDNRKLFIVGFDPGVTTGWCVMRCDLETLRSEGFRALALANPDPDMFSWEVGSFTGPEPYQAEQMMALLRGTWMHGQGIFDAGAESDLFVGIIESFSLREFSRDPSLLSSPRVAAAFLALAYRVLTIPVVLQTPSEALATIDDHRLKMLNLWSGPDGKDGEHQRDATKHCIVLARKVIDPMYLSSISSQMGWLR